MAKTADRYYGLGAYQIIEKGYDPAHSLVSESIFSLSNEHMGVRGYFEEGGAVPSLRGSYLGGVYETASLKQGSNYRGFVNRTHFMVTAADALATKLIVAGETLDLSACAFADFKRVLDMKTGLLSRSFLWQTRRAGRVEVRFERLLGMDRPDWLLQRVTLCALDGDAQATLSLGVNGNVEHQSTGRCQWSELLDRDAALKLRTETTDTVAEYRLHTSCAGDKRRERTYRTVTDEYAFPLAKGVTMVAERAVCVRVARHGAALAPMGDTPSFDELLKANAEHWRAFWNECDVEIEGDAENQQGVRYCLFQLHSTYRGLDARDNIGAKGLTGEAYNGHAFWDTETYCLPFYLLSDPQAARSLLLYRYHTLPQARERAKQLDLKGACYPIATMDGTEACALWQHASLQMQVSTAVAYAIQIYVSLSGDEAFLRREGAEMLCEIARYVLSRGGWNDKGFGFYGVMGPDEFHMMVSNDFYTNFMGKKALAYAADTVEKLDEADRAALAGKINLQADEPALWRRAANGMLLPRREDGVFEQHEGYFSLPHTDVQAVPVSEFPLYEHWSYDRIYRTDMLKQPDVLMAMFLYPDDFTVAEKAANYAFYEPRCIHESSLSPSVHAIIASQLGRYGDALNFFGFATRLDLDNYNRNTREGLHLSSVAAAWMTIVQGFGGLRFDTGEIKLSPWLPSGWSRLHFSLRVRDSLLRVSIEAQGVTLRCEGMPIAVTIYGKRLMVGAAPEAVFAQQASDVQPVNA